MVNRELKKRAKRKQETPKFFNDYRIFQNVYLLYPNRQTDWQNVYITHDHRWSHESLQKEIWLLNSNREMYVSILYVHTFMPFVARLIDQKIKYV